MRRQIFCTCDTLSVLNILNFETGYHHHYVAPADPVLTLQPMYIFNW